MHHITDQKSEEAGTQCELDLQKSEVEFASVPAGRAPILRAVSNGSDRTSASSRPAAVWSGGDSITLAIEPNETDLRDVLAFAAFVQGDGWYSHLRLILDRSGRPTLCGGDSIPSVLRHRFIVIGFSLLRSQRPIPDLLVVGTGDQGYCFFQPAWPRATQGMGNHYMLDGPESTGTSVKPHATFRSISRDKGWLPSLIHWDGQAIDQCAYAAKNPGERRPTIPKQTASKLWAMGRSLHEIGAYSDPIYVFTSATQCTRPDYEILPIEVINPIGAQLLLGDFGSREMGA